MGDLWARLTLATMGSMAAAALPSREAKIAVLVRLEIIVLCCRRCGRPSRSEATWHVKLLLVCRLSELGCLD